VISCFRKNANLNENDSNLDALLAQQQCGAQASTPEPDQVARVAASWRAGACAERDDPATESREIPPNKVTTAILVSI
jgi:hypothetical protein